MMNIAYCVPAMYNPGGMERVLTEKVNYLSTVYKYKITIITTEQNGKPYYFPLAENVNTIDFKLNFNSHFNDNLFNKTIKHYKKLKQYKTLLEDFLRINSVDICVSLGGKEIDFLTSLKDQSIKMAEIHFAKDIRKQFLMTRKSGIFWRLVGNYRTKQLCKATFNLSKLIVLTKSDKQEWEKTHNNIVQIYNPCPIDTDLCTNVNNKRIISVGKLDAQKGFDFLISAWSLVVKRFPDWTLNIYGQGEWKNMLEIMIKENHLEKQTYLKGITKNIQDKYLESSIYVMSSRYEGFPMVLVEALACGLPCVSFDCKCGPNELIEEGVNGYLVPLGDVQLLADRICALIENHSLRLSMSHKSKELSQNYILEPIMKQWSDLFETAYNNR